MSNNDETKIHLATKMVHWPGGPLFVCDRHAKIAQNIGAAMGCHVHVMLLEENEIQQCKNCLNEVEK